VFYVCFIHSFGQLPNRQIGLLSIEPECIFSLGMRDLPLYQALIGSRTLKLVAALDFLGDLSFQNFHHGFLM
jgi:hypothetical protein